VRPDYSTHDPKGWCGDPSRGAALGRPTIQKGDKKAFTDKLYLRRIPLTIGGYDCNGTYFGAGWNTLYWCAAKTDTHEIDFMLRASSRDEAKAEVLKDYPNARFFR
jgi:hypothetical protein